MSKIRVRFAPSPTGHLHVGGARTALFNWLYARHAGGEFILRVEDTDAGRSSPEMTEGILEAMRWMGLDWDEGPFFQSQRLALYRQAAQKVLDAGQAYRCYCAPGSGVAPGTADAEAEGSRPARPLPAAAAGHAGGLAPGDPCRECRHEDPAGRPFAIRFLVPGEGVTSFDDAVFGHLDFTNAELEDFVLLRSDGMPTYHLSVVADDIDMRMTHIVRGADHLSNTPKQVLLYRALGAEAPAFAHVPLILGPDRTRLSKRHGATSVTAYRDQGILAEAFRNFLALLGWNPGGDREILSAAEMIETFSLESISKSNAVFDAEKLLWFNQQYIQRYSGEELFPYVYEELKREGLWREEHAGGRARLERAIDLVKPRMRSLKDFPLRARAFFSDDYEIDPAAAQKFWKDAALRELLTALAETLAAVQPFGPAPIETALRAFAEQRGVKAGLLINAARVALTGQAVAPGIFEVMAVLGKERTVARLRAGARRIASS